MSADQTPEFKPTEPVSDGKPLTPEQELDRDVKEIMAELDKLIAQEKEKFRTPAQIIFAERPILNERPEGMDYKLYRKLRSKQTSLLKLLHTHKPSRRVAQLMPIIPGYNLHRL